MASLSIVKFCLDLKPWVADPVRVGPDAVGVDPDPVGDDPDPMGVDPDPIGVSSDQGWS